jgi:heme-degrading monooxygenase HmoA
MFARLTSMDIKVEQIEKGIKIYKESVIPAAKSQKGFVDAFLLLDRQTGKAVSVTFWTSEANALANERNRYYQEQLVKFIPFQTQPVRAIREAYKVNVKA